MDNDHSKDNIEKKLPLDEKMSLDYFKADPWKEDIIGSNTETNSLQIQWAEFHRCKNMITFAFQLVAVVSVQGSNYIIYHYYYILYHVKLFINSKI